MTNLSAGESCFDVISEVDDVMRGHLAVNNSYYIMGGVATSALKHPDTSFDHDSRLIYALADAAESTLRVNGTVRDIDILVDTVLDDGTAAEIKTDLHEAIDGKLEISVFGFDRHLLPQSPVDRIKRLFGDWISRRTIEGQTLRYELFPLTQEVSKESYEPWRLVLPSGKTVSVLHPVGHMLAYSMRSISGIRHKDQEKLGKMSNLIVANPVFEEEMRDGVFRSWLDFSDGIQLILEGKLPLESQLLQPDTSRIELAAFRWKGKLLHKLESQEALIKFAQHPIGEKILRGFVGTK